ncbi:hypothetical protein [Anaerostipes caccae]|nr:hypothetical protein [Anaerostipes caccae]UWN73301.1 hypothetical protein NQ561_07235 [Anaerostipes caccae L1-92]
MSLLSASGIILSYRLKKRTY